MTDQIDDAAAEIENDRDNSGIRAGEKAVEWPGASDAGIIFIGRIHTPWLKRSDCPRQGGKDGPVCRIDVFEPWAEALAGVEKLDEVEIFYWLHRSRRDLVLQCPRNERDARGVFSLRSPVRPNPIGVSRVALVRIDGSTLHVRGLDCLDGTPLIDIKPDRCLFAP